MPNTLSTLRTDRITGSRLPAILGLSPYATRADKLREMVREHFMYPEEFEGNVATEWGQLHEADAVADYELLTGMSVSLAGDQQVTYTGGPLGGAFALTPDAVVTEDDDRPMITVEAKCPYRATYTSIWERPDYEQQCRLSAALLDVEFTDFVVWRESGTNISRVVRDQDRDGNDFDWWQSKPAELYPHLARAAKDTVISECERFLEEYAQIIALDPDHPDVKAHTEGIPGRRTDAEWTAREVAVLELHAELSRIQTAYQDALAELLAVAKPGDSVRGSGVHLIWRSPARGGQGAVSWKKAAEVLADKAGVALDDAFLDQFRGRASASAGGFAVKFLEEVA